MRLKLQFETDKSKIIAGRVSRSYFDGKLFGCSVCWTCRRFDMRSMECNPHPWAEQINEDSFEDNVKGVCITSPGFYRCSFWEEKE